MENRSKKAFYNTVVSFLYEIVQLICGLILPRLILTTFGSSYNGLTSSISQFISCISLLTAGIGGVTRAALYKPLAQRNYYDISCITNQTEKFLKKIALIFIGCAVIFAAIYPLWISKEFDWFFSFSLVLIISFSTFFQYYFGLTYQLVLNADQKLYIVSLISIATTILNTILAVIIMKLGGGIHLVKLGSAFAYILSPLTINFFVKKKYHIDKTAKNGTDLIKQRWDAVGHAVANFVNDNTDIMVLTIFSGLGNVSIYVVYSYVISSIRKVVVNFVTGFGAAFGNMYAKGETELMYENLRIYEVIVFSVASIMYSVTFVMITPFVMVYTKGVTDVNYFHPVFGIIITLAGAFTCFRIPYETIVKAVGHYKQTRNASILEAVINIVISVACVIKFGLVGVAIGTLVAAIYRSTLYATYLSKNILKRSIWIYIIHTCLVLLIALVVYFLSCVYMIKIDNIFNWVIMAFLTTIAAIALTVVTDLIFYFDDTKKLTKKMLGIFKKNK